STRRTMNAFCFQAEDGIRGFHVTGVQTCALPISQTADEATVADACGAARFISLIGTPADQIDQSALPPRTRIITPDMMVTQDFEIGRASCRERVESGGDDVF